MATKPEDLGAACSALLSSLAGNRHADSVSELLAQTKDALGCDAVIFAEQVDALTLVCRKPAGGDPMLLSMNNPQVLAPALQPFQCVAYSDYREVLDADPLLVSWGVRGLAILPANREGETALALLLIWKSVVKFPDDLAGALGPLWALTQALLPQRKTETDLAVARERLTAILETIPEGVVFVDDDGLRGWLNSPAGVLLQLPTGDASPDRIANAMRMLRGSAQNTAEMQRLSATLARDARAEIRDWRWDLANPRRVLSVASRATQIQGVAGRVWVFRDITGLILAEEELKSQEERWQLALAGTNEGIWDWNALTGEVFYSARWKQMLGYAEDELPNDAAIWRQMLHPDDLERVEKDLQRHLDGLTPFYAVEYRLRCRDGSWKWVLAHGKAVWDEQGRPLRLVGAHTDMTERKQADELLREAKQAADDANAAKSTFLARMSHEIRTPMNAILGLSDLLWDSNLNSTQRDYVRVFRNNAQRLLHLINDILDLSKVEAGALTLETAPFVPADIIDNVRDLFAVQAEQKKLTLRFEVDPEARQVFMGDGNRLEQILVNLVGNALKFTEYGGVTVRAGRNPEDPGPGRLLFSISDTGPGIAAADLENIFAPFVQADTSATRKYHGTGLGLAITRKFVELMNGSIRAESVLGTGSAFIFSLTLPPASSPERERKSAPSLLPAHPRQSSRARILVADDSEDNRYLIGAYLNGFPWELDYAEDGGAALRKALSGNYSLILMDVQMPEYDGYEVTQRIRNQEKLTGRQAVPIIALTAHASQAEGAKARAKGCTAYLSKPIAKRALILEIEAWLPQPDATNQSDFDADGLPAVVRGLIPGYLRNREPEPDRIMEHLTAGDFEAIAVIGHKLKGSGASFGLMALTELGAKLEKAAKMRYDPEIRTLVEDLRGEIAAAATLFPPTK